jgi:hypothetical protein
LQGSFSSKRIHFWLESAWFSSFLVITPISI